MKLRTSRVWYLMRRIEVEAGTASHLFSPQDIWGRNMDLETLGRLCAEAWHDDLPEADRAWAEAHREKFGRWVDDSRPEAIRPRVDAGSPESLTGRFDKEPAPPWPMPARTSSISSPRSAPATSSASARACPCPPA